MTAISTKASSIDDGDSLSAKHSALRSKLLEQHPFLAQLPAYNTHSRGPTLGGEKQQSGLFLPPSGNQDVPWSSEHASDQLDSQSTPRISAMEEEKPAYSQPLSAYQAVFGPADAPEEQSLRLDDSRYCASGFQDLPANAVCNRGIEGRFKEYPKLRRLLDIKRQLVDESASPATYLAADLRDSLGPPPGHPQRTGSNSSAPFHLASLMPVKYDVVLIDAPLACYEWNSIPSPGSTYMDQTWSWDELGELPIPLLAAKESFVFLWVGPGCSDGLERGRATLSRWGYRRCEVITWCLASNPNDPQAPSPVGGAGDGLLASTAVHLLVGIRGTVKRSQDSNFVHCNVDADVLFWEGEPRENIEPSSFDSPRPIDIRLKPPELYTIIENFCLGTRRIELFGTNRNLRRGWITVGLPSTIGPDAPGWDRVLRHENAGAMYSHSKFSEGPQAYIKERYVSNFKVDPVGCPLSMRSNVVPFNEAVENLRPRTPPQQSSHLPSSNFDPDFNDSNLAGRAASPEGDPSVVAALTFPRGLGASIPNLRGRLSPAASRVTVAHPTGFASPNNQHARSPTAGLGAGGPVTVSLQSGSERLSGPQKSAVGLGMATAGGAGGTGALRGRGGGGSGGRGGRGTRYERTGRGGKVSDTRTLGASSETS